GGDERADEDPEDEVDAPVDELDVSGDEEGHDVGRRRRDAEAGGPAGRGAQRPRGDGNDADDDGGGEGVPGLLEEQVCHTAPTRREGGELRLGGEVPGGRVADGEHEPPDEPPRRDAERLVDGGEADGLRPRRRREVGEGPVLHDGGRAGVEDEGEPRADEALARPVERPRGAAAGEDDRETEDEGADDRGDRGELAAAELDDAERVEGEDADALDGDDDEERGDPARIAPDPHIAEGTGDAEAPPLHGEAERSADGKSGEDHG